MKFAAKYASQMISVENRVIRNAAALAEAYLPNTLHARDCQVRRVEAAIPNTGCRALAPKNLWVYGKPGSGKTTVALHALERVGRSGNLPTAYVNCWRHPTLHSVVDAVNQHLHILETERSDAAVRLAHLQHALKDRTCILVLDEVDLAPPRERNRIIYNLLAIPGIRLICICNSRYPLTTLDARTSSRLRPGLVDFPPYTATELLSILQARSDLALRQGSVGDEVLRHIAELADGDARLAVQTLRSAAEAADGFRHPKVQLRHVEASWQQARYLKHRYLIDHLSWHHRLLYELVRATTSISSSQLRDCYERRCSAEGRQPVARRTFQTYIQTLIRLRLIKAERAHRRGAVWLYSLSL